MERHRFPGTSGSSEWGATSARLSGREVHVRRWVAFLLVLVWCTAGGLAEDPQPTPTPESPTAYLFEDEYEFTLVNLDVFVRDAEGRAVEGLEVDDFRVYQDGQEMQVTNFAVLDEERFEHVFGDGDRTLPGVGRAAEEETPGDLSRAEIRPIHCVIYVDNENLRPLQRNRVLRQVRTWVDETMRPPMRVMVMSHAKNLKVVEPFTSDPQVVKAALRSLRRHTGGLTERDSTRRDLIEMMRDAQNEEKRMEGASTRSGQMSQLRARMYRLVTGFADDEANTVRFSLAALREMVNMVAGMPGRKIVLYVSDGMPMVPGRDLVHEYAMTFQDSRIMSVIHRYEFTRDFRSLVTFAASQGVTLYTVETQGLQSRSGMDVESQYAPDVTTSTIGAHNYQDSLRYLADNTGGLAIVNTNDVSDGLQRIRKDLFTYYSLGYRLASSGADKVHRVRIECPKHPEYDLRYRDRFVEKSRESRVQDKVMTSLVFDVEHNPMDVRVETGRPAPATSERWTVPLEVSVPIRNVALIPEGEDYVGRLVLFVAARDTEGRQSDLQRQEHEIRLPAEKVDESRTQRFSIRVPLLMRSGAFRISVGLLDQVTHESSYAERRMVVGSEAG